MKKDPVSILFVCTGNICRSPTAEAVFRHQVKAAGLEDFFRIDSAGTHGYHIGDPPDPRSIDVALERGVDMRDLRARKVASQDFETFQHVIAMDRGHQKILQGLHNQAGRAELGLFSDPHDVADPYYGAIEDFKAVYRQIERDSQKLLERLVRLYALPGK